LIQQCPFNALIVEELGLYDYCFAHSATCQLTLARSFGQALHLRTAAGSSHPLGWYPPLFSQSKSPIAWWGFYFGGAGGYHPRVRRFIFG